MGGIRTLCAAVWRTPRKRRVVAGDLLAHGKRVTIDDRQRTSRQRQVAHRHTEGQKAGLVWQTWVFVNPVLWLGRLLGRAVDHTEHPDVPTPT